MHFEDIREELEKLRFPHIDKTLRGAEKVMEIPESMEVDLGEKMNISDASDLVHDLFCLGNGEISTRGFSEKYAESFVSDRDRAALAVEMDVQTPKLIDGGRLLSILEQCSVVSSDLEDIRDALGVEVYPVKPGGFVDAKEVAPCDLVEERIRLLIDWGRGEISSRTVERGWNPGVSVTYDIGDDQ